MMVDDCGDISFQSSDVLVFFVRVNNDDRVFVVEFVFIDVPGGAQVEVEECRREI